MPAQHGPNVEEGGQGTLAWHERCEPRHISFRWRRRLQSRNVQQAVLIRYGSSDVIRSFAGFK